MIICHNLACASYIHAHLRISDLSLASFMNSRHHIPSLFPRRQSNERRGEGWRGESVIELLGRPSSHVHLWARLNWRLRGLVRSPRLSHLCWNATSRRGSRMFSSGSHVLYLRVEEQTTVRRLSRAELPCSNWHKGLSLSLQHTHMHTHIPTSSVTVQAEWTGKTSIWKPICAM